MNTQQKLLALSLVAASAAATAADTATATAINSAFSAGQANVQLVVGGILALGAVVTGLGLIYKWLSK